MHGWYVFLSPMPRHKQEKDGLSRDSNSRQNLLDLLKYALPTELTRRGWLDNLIINSSGIISSKTILMSIDQVWWKCGPWCKLKWLHVGLQIEGSMV